MARPTNKPKKPPLSLIIWANITKWQIVKGIEDSEIAALLKIQRLDARRRSHKIDADEMETICELLQIEPEKLLER